MGISLEERAGATLLVAGDDEGNGPDASKQWEEFEQFRDQAETTTEAGMIVGVYRVPTNTAGNPDGQDNRHLFSAPIDRYDLVQIFDRVKREFMPRGYGTTTVRIMIREKGARGVRWQKLYVVEKSAIADDLPEANPGSTDNSGVNALAAAMRDQNNLIMQLIANKQNAPVAPAIDPIQQALQLTAAISGMVTAVNSKQTLIGAATGGAVDTLGSIKEMFGFLKSIGVQIGTGDNFSRDDGDDNSLSKMLEVGKPYVELLGKMIERAPVAPVPGARRTPQLAAPTPAIVAPGANGQAASRSSAPPVVEARPEPVPAPGFEATPIVKASHEGTDPMLLELAKHVSGICTLLDQGQGEPAGIAKLILDAVPAEYDEKFYAIVADDSWLLKLASLDRRVNNHAEFFSEVRTLILAEFADETEAEPPAA